MVVFIYLFRMFLVLEVRTHPLPSRREGVERGERILSSASFYVVFWACPLFSHLLPLTTHL